MPLPEDAWPIWHGQTLPAGQAVLVHASTHLAATLASLGEVAEMARRGHRVMLSPPRAHAALLSRGWGVWAIWPADEVAAVRLDTGPAVPSEAAPHPVPAAGTPSLHAAVGAQIDLADLAKVLAADVAHPGQPARALSPRLHLSLAEVEAARLVAPTLDVEDPSGPRGLLGWWLQGAPVRRLRAAGLVHAVWSGTSDGREATDTATIHLGPPPSADDRPDAPRWLEAAARLAQVDQLLTDDTDAAALALALGRPVAWLGRADALPAGLASLGDGLQAVEPMAFQQAYAAHLPSRAGPLRELPLADAQAAMLQLVEAGPHSTVAALRDACARLLLVHPRRPDAWRLLGTLAQQADQLPLATGCHTRVTELAHGYADGWRSLGLLLADQGADAPAIEALREAATRAPHDVTVRLRLAELVGQAGRHGEAIGLLRAVVQHQPAHWDAHLTLGAWLLADDQPEAASHHLQAALSGTPADDDRTRRALARLAEALRRQDDLEGAAASLRRWLQLAPDAVEATLSLAALERLGPQPDRASLRLAPLVAAAPHDTALTLAWQSARRCALDWTPPPSFVDAAQAHAARHAGPSGPAAALDLDTLWRLAETADDATVAAALRPTWTAALPRPASEARAASEAFVLAPPAAPRPKMPAGSRPPARPRVRYAGSRDAVHRHATLLAALLDSHDRAHWDVQVLCWTRQPAGPIDAHDAGGHSTDALGDIDTMHDASDTGIAARLADDHIDLLIDLDGCGPQARPGIWLRHPARLQLAWLDQLTDQGLPGYDARLVDGPPARGRTDAGGHATSACDVDGGLMAVRPLPSDWLPAGSAHRVRLRRALGLPEQAPVVAALAPHAQIDPLTWGGWLRGLAACPPAHLWLAPGPGQPRLRAAAQAAGIRPERLHFIAPESAPGEGALAAADLYLSTLTEGAHGHAALLDALAAAVPAVCVDGPGPATRWAGELLRRAGLAQCVSQDAAARDALTVTLMRSPRELLGLRHALIQAHRTAPLFQVARLATAMESVFTNLLAPGETSVTPRAA